MMYSHVHCSIVMLAILIPCFMGDSKATGVTDGVTGGRSQEHIHRAHGDPCERSSDTSLVCCVGVSESTLIHRDEECCNGRPLNRDEICCADVIAVPLTSPSHDACCLDRDTLQSTTYDSRRQYCNPDFGTVRRIPALRHHRPSSTLTSTSSDSSLTSSSSSSSSSDPSFSSSSSSDAGLASPSLPRLPRLFSLLSSSSSSSSSLFSNGVLLDEGSSLSSVYRWCEAGEDENRSLGPRGRGEAVRCCGRTSYFPSRQTCCLGVLYDLPSDQAQCCYDRAYSRGDADNPCLGLCGQQAFNSQAELCCDGVVHPVTSVYDVCCGREKISSDTHTCCAGGLASLAKDGAYRCCGERVPFVRRFMRCPRRRRQNPGGRGGLERREGAPFHTSSLCRRTVPLWRRDWPLPDISGQELTIEGVVNRTTKSQRRSHVALTLTPFRVVKPATLDDVTDLTACSGSNQIQLVARLDAASLETCQGRQLRHYLNGNTLTVYSPLTSLSCSRQNNLVLNIPSSSVDHLVLRTRV